MHTQQSDLLTSLGRFDKISAWFFRDTHRKSKINENKSSNVPIDLIQLSQTHTGNEYNEKTSIRFVLDR